MNLFCQLYHVGLFYRVVVPIKVATIWQMTKRMKQAFFKTLLLEMKEKPEASSRGCGHGRNDLRCHKNGVRNIPKPITLHEDIYKTWSGFVLYLRVYTANRGDARHWGGILPLDSCFCTSLLHPLIHTSTLFNHSRFCMVTYGTHGLIPSNS